MRVIPSDDLVVPLQSGEIFSAPTRGYFLSDSLYRKYRRAVGDKIMLEELRDKLDKR